MADIFLSYARADQARVEKLASVLEGAGYSVWWDRDIDGGSEFSQDIERELTAAKAVVVAWTETSTRSRWVRDEASMGLEEGKLVAISLDGTPPPLGFKQIHAIDMQAKTGEADLLRGLSRKFDAGEVAEPAARNSMRKERSKKPLLFAAIALLVLLVAGLAIIRPGPLANMFGSSAVEEGPISVAVLPFTFSADPELDDMEASLSASLATSLARSSEVSVASYSNTRSALARNLAAAELGEELGVRYFIEGEINSAGFIIFANLSMIEADTGRTVWSRAVRGDKRGIAFLPMQISRALTGMLLTHMAERDGHFELPENLDPRAREAFLTGYELLFERGTVTPRPDAMRQFEVAASLAPEFADAHGALAFILADSTPRDLSLSREDLERRQQETMERALALDPANRLARLAGASATLEFHGDVAAAIDQLDVLVQEKPKDVFGHQLYAAAHILAGNPRDALTQVDQASRMDLESNQTFTLRLLALFQIGDYMTIKQTVAACPDPCGGMAWMWHGALIRTGTLSAYRSDIEEIIAMADRDPWGIPSDEMDTIARAFVASDVGTIRPEDGIAEGLPFMQVLVRFGRIEDAFRVANRNLYTQPTIDLIWLLDGSRMTIPEAIRADPRYHAIFERPRFKGIADYRRAQGLTNGLPVFPVQPYEGNPATN